MAAVCPVRMRRQRWKTAAAFWAGRSWCCRRMDWSLQLEPAPEKGTQAVVRIPLYTGESRPDGTVELRTSSETEREQRKYHLRAMLVREMRTMPERGDPDEEL